MLCGIGGLTPPFWVTMCSNWWLPPPDWMATILLKVFGFSDFQITRPACSPLASIALVSSRAVTVHSPLGASWSSVFEASASLAMKSPWRIGRPRLPFGDLRAAAGRAQHGPLGVERRAVELVRLRQAAAAAAARRLRS